MRPAGFSSMALGAGLLAGGLLLLASCSPGKEGRMAQAQKLNNVGIALYGRGDLNAALERFTKALEVAPSFGIAQNNAGVGYYHKGRVDLAAVHFRRAAELEPRKAEVRGNLGVALLILERHAEAEKELKEAILLDPKYLLAYSNLGVLFYRTGRVSEAVEVYRKGIAQDPGFDRLHHNLGEALLSRGDYDGAVAEYEEALKLNPEAASTFNNLAWAFATRGEKLDDALALANAALEKDPENGFFADTLGTIYLRLGMFEEARDTLSRAVGYQPRIPEIHLHLGEAFRWQGRYKEALEEYGRAIALEPYGETATQANQAAWALRGILQ